MGHSKTESGLLNALFFTFKAAVEVKNGLKQIKSSDSLPSEQSSCMVQWSSYFKSKLLSVPKSTANLYCICLSIDLRYT